MRKFYVIYKYVLGVTTHGECIISLNENEKANQETFNKKLTEEMGADKNRKAIIWSLIEE